MDGYPILGELGESMFSVMGWAFGNSIFWTVIIIGGLTYFFMIELGWAEDPDEKWKR